MREVNLIFSWRLDHPADPARPILRAEFAGNTAVGERVSGHAILRLVETPLMPWDHLRALVVKENRYQPESVTLDIDGVGMFHANRQEIRLPPPLRSESGQWRLVALHPRLIEFLASAARLAEDELKRWPE
jgi:hypothetical protein